jgi:hypothetical protein
MGRMAEPSDIAAACLFLASPLAGYVTGADLAVHGGGEVPARYLAAHGDDDRLPAPASVSSAGRCLSRSGSRRKAPRW